MCVCTVDRATHRDRRGMMAVITSVSVRMEPAKFIDVTIGRLPTVQYIILS